MAARNQRSQPAGASPSLIRPLSQFRVEREAARAGVKATVLGFERDMPARVAEAHLVVGKAGGLTVSETLTAGRPMIIVGAVPGNEALNEAFVVAGEAGRGASAREVGPLAHAMRDHVEPLGRRARSLVVHQAADHVVELACFLSIPGTRILPAA